MNLKFSVTILFALVITLLASQGCKKKTTPTDEPTPATASVSAKVNGVDWKADLQYSVVKTSDSTYQFSASDKQYNEVKINFKGNTTGTYTLTKYPSPNYASFYLYQDTTGSSKFFYTDSTNTGTFTLTTFDLGKYKASGTFSFVGKANNGTTRTITDGKFENVNIAHE